LLASERDSTGWGACPVADRSGDGRAIDGQRLAVIESPHARDVPAIEQLLGEEVLPITAALWNRVAEVHVHRLWAVACHVLVQLVGSPWVPLIEQGFRPGVIPSKLNSASEPFFNLHLQRVIKRFAGLRERIDGSPPLVSPRKGTDQFG